ncbi:hypothetical protein H2O64_07160 [Kordia sp. YSTF-M3]|uniref:Uncharacterized protein n=1 Tax=Kordia aestuariivivens TaxID=2759037 RepID=A0ABR7Q7B8_9FLAO|nr:hypothetical protein [Kordia aestuariivivens]MBC8754445.1 hypothetical protein [Kordia aestuariivivens]
MKNLNVSVFATNARIIFDATLRELVEVRGNLLIEKQIASLSFAMT